jgi:hypothetical protein
MDKAIRAKRQIGLCQTEMPTDQIGVYLHRVGKGHRSIAWLPLQEQFFALLNIFFCSNRNVHLSLILCISAASGIGLLPEAPLKRWRSVSGGEPRSVRNSL